MRHSDALPSATTGVLCQLVWYRALGEQAKNKIREPIITIASTFLYIVHTVKCKISFYCQTQSLLKSYFYLKLLHSFVA